MLVDHDEQPLAWREAGAGSAVVFLHGLGGSRIAWDPQLVDLGQTFRCIAWDMPGYGRSAPRIPLTYASIADAIVDLLDQLGLERVHLVGESFGGMQALHAALRHPTRIDRLVLTNTSPAFGMNGTDPDGWRRARLQPLDDGHEPSHFARTVLEAIAGPDLDPAALEARVAAFSRIPSEGLRASIECLPTNDVRAHLPRITHPTLVIAGSLDTETPQAYAEVLDAGLPNSELVVLDGIGHLAASEAPEQFNRLVRRFLFDHSTSEHPRDQDPK